MKLKNVAIRIQGDKWGNMYCRVDKKDKEGRLYDFTGGKFDGFIEDVTVEKYIPKGCRSEYIKIISINK